MRDNVWSNKNIAAVLFGVAFIWAVTAMFLSDSFNPNCFYNVGEIYDYSQSDLCRHAEGWSYDSEKDCTQIDEDISYIFYDVKNNNSTKWNYLIFNIEKLDNPALYFQIIFYDSNGNDQQNVLYRVQEGNNIVQLSSISCVRYMIKVENAKGTTFRIKKMQLRQKVVEHFWSKLIIGICLGGSVYGFMIGIIKFLKEDKKKKIDTYVVIDGLQSFFLKIIQKISIPIEGKNRRMMRVSILVFIFLAMHVRELWTTGLVENMYRVELAYSIGLVLISFLLLQGNDAVSHRNWKNPLVYCWFLTAFIQCISDFFVKKRTPFQGYVKIFVFAFLYFAWNNSKNKFDFIKEIILALKIDFMICLIFCILCRPYAPGSYYLGCYTNSNTFGMYLIIVAAALLQSIWIKLENTGKVITAIDDMVLLAILMNLLWKTQCRGAMMSIFVAVIGIVALICFRKNLKELLYGIKIFVCVVIISFLTGGVLNYGLTNIPDKTGMIVSVQQDERTEGYHGENLWTNTVYAAGLKEKLENSKWNSRMLGGDLESITGGRTLIWKNYLRHINLFGNYFRLQTSGISNYAHNEILQHVYNYGVCILVPYMLQLFLTIKYAWHYGRRQGKMWIFIWCIFISSFLMGMIDVTELPFRLHTWLIPGMLLGVLFEETDEIRFKEV